MKALAALCLLATTANADRRCVIDKPPVLPTPRLAVPACHQPSKALARTLFTEITHGFEPTETGGKPDLVFPCDGLGAQIDEITIETGEGHGFSLNLYVARRSGAQFDVRGIAFRGSSAFTKAATPPFQRVTGSVTLDLDRLRAATTAQLTEVFPPRDPNVIPGMSGSFSSHDFHILIRLRDSDGRVVERMFTGYEGNSEQTKFLPLIVAREALTPILTLASVKAPIDNGDRELFTERFNAAVPHFDEPFRWWVMEHFVDLSRFLGTPKIIPGLLTRMTVPKARDRSRTDARRDALQALATITGWDARRGVSDEEAGKRYLAECK